VYLHKEDVCSCFCKRNGHGLTNSSCTTCDEGRLTLEGVELLHGGHYAVNVDAVIGTMLLCSELLCRRISGTADSKLSRN
jgi:hypothetical protein